MVTKSSIEFMVILSLILRKKGRIYYSENKSIPFGEKKFIPIFSDQKSTAEVTASLYEGVDLFFNSLA